MSQSLIDRVALGYAALTKSDAGSRWRWAHQILALRNSAPNTKALAKLDVELGAKCAKAVNRAKPYSPQWIRAFVNAANKFPHAPSNAEQCAAFIALCNNAQSKPQAAAQTAGQTSGSESAQTLEGALKRLAKAIRAAIKLGATADDIEATITTITQNGVD